MASWRKLLARMVSDPNPRSFTYQEAATVLGNLGFHLAKSGGSSHRRWRRVVEAEGGPRTVVIGLVEKGSGTLRPEYVKQMVRILRENGLLLDGV
jgi:hypothetical protein